MDAVHSLIGGTNPSAVVDSSSLYDVDTGVGCIDAQSQFFIQHTCVMSQQQQDAKFRQIAFYSCIAVFVAFFYFLRIRHLMEKVNLDHIEWDLSTVTAADYTVNKVITHEEYNDWLENHYNNAVPSPG